MFCPRHYQLSIIEGWKQNQESVDLEFGRYFASATETYKKARLAGETKQGATVSALRATVEATWLYDPPTDPLHHDPDFAHSGRPWGGHYEEQWRCRGETPYKNAKGNHAKCPWSHKGAWFPEPAPGTCGSCGSGTETQRRWVSGDHAKDRYTLFRLVAWWCDDQAEEEGILPYKFPDGTPAVELSFTLPLPWYTPVGGEPYLLSGHLDGIDVFGSENFIGDNKTTKKMLSNQYWKQYEPNVQIKVYDLAGSVLYPDLGIKGVRIDAAQTLVGGARFGAKVFYSSDTLRAEFLTDLEWWIRQAERFAQDDYWPMNLANCSFCQFNGICSKSLEKRQMYLESNFHKKFWNPLEER